jgi:DNA-binding response OmpR family regulator
MGRTLIVDDMEEVYDEISHYFESPIYAKTMEEGLKEIASGNYDLVISDYHLGDEFPRGGLEIIKAAEKKGLKSILMSTENHEKEAEELGAKFMFKKELFGLLGDYDGRK